MNTVHAERDRENKIYYEGLNPFAITALSGPSHFCYFRDVCGKRILLLGEYHYAEDQCPKEVPVWIWLEQLFKLAPDCIDFFFEYSYSNIPEHEYRWKKLWDIASEDVLVNLERINFPCLQRDKKSCPYDSVRIHFTDIREIYTSRDRNFRIIAPFVRYSELYSSAVVKIERNRKVRKIFKNNLEALVDYVLGIDNTGEKIYFDFLDQVAKEALGISIYNTDKLSMDPSLKLQTAKEYRIHVKKTIEKEIGKLSDSERFLRLLKDVFIIYLKTEDDILFTLDSVAMDTYILIRMFINFDLEKMYRGPKLCRETETPKHVIFYGGAYHSLIQSQFISLYCNTSPTIEIKNNKREKEFQCIRLPQAFDFFERSKCSM